MRETRKEQRESKKQNRKISERTTVSDFAILGTP